MTKGALFSLRIDGNAELLRCVPIQWIEKLFIPEAQEKIVMDLELDRGLNDSRFPVGWSKRAIHGNQQIVYAPKGRAIFALRYRAPDNSITVSVGKAMDGFVRPGILYGILTVLHQYCVGLHGVTLVRGKQGIILSAPSGTGKTTLAKLLKSYSDTRVINGDFALLSLTESGVWFEPTPFCGTSGVCLNERIKVDRIVFLSQSKENSWQELSVRNAMVSFMSNAYVPTFDPQLQQVVQDNILRMLSCLRVNSYAFAPTREAAELFRDQLIREGMTSQEN